MVTSTHAGRDGKEKGLVRAREQAEVFGITPSKGFFPRRGLEAYTKRGVSKRRF